MNAVPRRLTLLFGLVIALVISIQLWTIFHAQTVHAQTIRETLMTPMGGVEEINPDSDGNLWVSEYVADTILRVNPTNNTFTRYSGELNGVVDARLGPNNRVWFNGYDDGALGRIDLSNNSVITWTIPGAAFTWGLAIESNGNIWTAEHDVATIHRFNPGTNELCTFDLPNESKSVYLHATPEGIWLGDYITDSMLRLNTVNNQLTSWKIETNGFNSNPNGMTSDDAGRLWWADGGLGAVGNLNPTTNRMSFYTASGVSSPNYIDVDGNSVWFADTFIDQFGVFNSTLAAISTSYVVTPTTATLTPACANLGSGNASTVNVTSGDLAFVDTEVAAPTRLACGWAVQKTPTETNMIDIVFASGRVWVSDAGRSTLIATPDNLSDLVDGTCNFSSVFMPALRR